MQINNIKSVNNVNFGNSINKPAVSEPQKNETLESAGISYDAANALRTQVLYQKPTDNIKYLDDNLNKKEIIAALKDTNKMERTFFGYKNRIANLITKSEDKKLTVDNFNILMNAKNRKLKANDIADILSVATGINNKKINEKSAKEYGFDGGLLDNKAIDSILDKIEKDRKLMAEQNNQMLNYMMWQDQITQQQMMQQQMMQDQMMQQQIMMSTPGMGFC